MIGLLTRTCTLCGNRRRHVRRGTCRLCRSRTAVSRARVSANTGRIHAGFDFCGLLAAVLRGLDD